MLAQLKAWNAAGSHRIKAKHEDTQYADHAAVAISDELVPNLIRAFYDRILADGGSGGVESTGGATLPGYAKVPMQWVNTPNSGDAHLGSAYDGGFEGYLMSTLPAAPRPEAGRRVRTRADRPGVRRRPGDLPRGHRPGPADDVRRPGQGQRLQRRVVAGPTRPSRTRPARRCRARLDHPSPARHRRPAAPRLAEPADLPAGGGVPAAPGAVRWRGPPPLSTAVHVGPVVSTG